MDEEIEVVSFAMLTLCASGFLLPVLQLVYHYEMDKGIAVDSGMGGKEPGAEAKIDEEIYKEVAAHLSITIDGLNQIFNRLAEIKCLGSENVEKCRERGLTLLEKRFFCFEYGPYSYLDRGFIRVHERRANAREKEIFINLYKKVGSMKKDNWKIPYAPETYPVVSAILQVIDDRHAISSKINKWLKIALEIEEEEEEIEEETLPEQNKKTHIPDQWMVVEMLRAKIPPELIVK